MGAQASNDQFEKTLSYIDIGKKEAAKVMTGGVRAELSGDLSSGYYIQPTIFQGNNEMRILQEEIFGPVVSTRASRISTTRSRSRTTRCMAWALACGPVMATSRIGGRAIEAGRVWPNCYHLYPAHAAFGGYKNSGIGRENHKMMLSHYQQTKNLLVSYSPKAMGFF